MTARTKILISLAVVVVLAIALTTVAGAQSAAVPQTRPSSTLPPLPEWPIIGPILRRLGLVDEPGAEVLPTPDPALTEYRIETREDVYELREIEANERVRLVAADGDLNAIIRDALAETEFREDVNLRLRFEDPTIVVEAFATSRIVDRVGVDVPIRIPQELNMNAAFTATAGNCVATLVFESFEANGWRLGLAGAANRILNAQIPDLWPNEICLEQVIVADGEIAVEGYRR